MSKPKIIGLILLVAVSVTAVVVFANKWRNNLNYDKITIEGNHTIPSTDILEIARLREDSTINLDELNIDLIQDRISKHPEIKKAFVSKEPPDLLKIEVIEKRPIAVLNTSMGIKLIDDELEIFPYRNIEKIYDLPVISGIRTEDNIKGLNNINKNELRAALFIVLNAFKESKGLYNNISEINIADSTKLIVYSNEKSIPFYLPYSNAQDVKSKEYQEVVRTKMRLYDNFMNNIFSKIMTREIEYVDLRFSNQVVVKYKI
ncbi:MAG TPA: FtsQ-type POTRA domain-containing protein [Ignavibacteria bacterium]|nr:FtsQ-type POTRA domain-containing protein [Ignavibacteria bacterium]